MDLVFTVGRVFRYSWTEGRPGKGGNMQASHLLDFGHGVLDNTE